MTQQPLVPPASGPPASGPPAPGPPGPPASVPPPWAAAPAPRPGRPIRRSSTRRAVLLVSLFGAVVGIVLSMVALDALVAGVNRGSAIAQSQTTSDLPDCREQYGDWIATWVDEELPSIRSEYGQNEDAVVIPWSTLDGFPAAAFGWADAVPDCGSTMLVDSTGEVWSSRLDVASIDKARFTAISTTLSAMGYRLTADQVPLDLLSIDGVDTGDGTAEDAEDQSGSAGSASWFREFSSATGTVSLTFYPDDPAALNPVGELVIVYLPPLS